MLRNHVSTHRHLSLDALEDALLRPCCTGTQLTQPDTATQARLRGCERINSKSQIQDSEWVLSPIHQRLRILESGIRNLESDSFTSSEPGARSRSTRSPATAYNPGSTRKLAPERL